MRNSVAARVLLLIVAVGLAPSASADDGNMIDRCWLDEHDVLHCSTPNRRSFAAQTMVLNWIAGFDLDGRTQYLAAAHKAWQEHQKGGCHSSEISISSGFSADNGPGRDDGLHIRELDNKCERIRELAVPARELR